MRLTLLADISVCLLTSAALSPLAARNRRSRIASLRDFTEGPARRDTLHLHARDWRQSTPPR
ncbi:hypothetical protein [Amycolatopsis minnesotensis]|uniref:hypothetical protein n=1 Tax=Amycolatopsis minnesotensis TaxID=337894 RepID=UPI0031D8C3F3